MKNIGYLLLVAGFLGGAYVAALDSQLVDWNMFAFAAFAAVAGVLVAKRAAAAMARSDTVLQTNRNELNESIANLVRDLDQVAEDISGDQLRDWIDDTLRNDLRRFAEARASMVHLYGLQNYADIMSEFAAGERYVNRVWSAAADGYNEEARRYLVRAGDQFRHAQSQLASVASQTM